ncbi:MAG TPA: Ig-like domain-containing protein [Fimbriimonadales bacterium]|nr:Ig-like domain-containing protein [Fimbriimonadales bacterium]
MRSSLLLFLIFFPLVILASGSVRLSAYPNLSVADGKSVITISAEARDSGGRIVADGSSVHFTTNLGTFREADTTTINGVARAILVAPNSPGIARITATVPSVGTVGTLEIEFVKDRSVLSATRQYIEISSPEYLVYHNELQIVSAAGKEKPAFVKYKDISIDAADLQLDLKTLVVLAKDAEITVGGEKINCKRLRYSLYRRRGSAIAQKEGRAGYFQLMGSRLDEGSGMTPNEFEFQDVGRASSSIHAERIIAFPQRELQFHRARVYVGDMRVLSMPLYALRLSNVSQGNPLGEQIVSYFNNSIVLNYPYFVSLTPSFMSVLRLRSGSIYGRGYAASGGVFLDWENSYQGQEYEGSCTLGGVGRKDMGLIWQHSHHFSDDTSVNAVLEFPSFDSVFGSVTAARPFDGFSVNVSATSSKSFDGFDAESRRAELNMDTDPERIGRLPATFSLGLTAVSGFARLEDKESHQEGAGMRSRLVLLPQKLSSNLILNGSLTLSHLWGEGRGDGFGVVGNLGVVSKFGNSGSLTMAYDYVHDAFTETLTGRHRLTAQVTERFGPLSFSAYGVKSLDVDSHTLFFDGSYFLNKKWRIGTSLTFDRYFGSELEDKTLILGYRIGVREVAITYSTDTGKFGFQLINAPVR